MDSDSDFDPEIDLEVSDEEEWVPEYSDSEEDGPSFAQSPSSTPLTPVNKGPESSVKNGGDFDPGPPSSLPDFSPGRTPGVQLPKEVRTRKDKTGFNSPLDFFRMFFTMDLVTQLCRYTNENASRHGGTKVETFRGWYDMEPHEFYRLLGLLMYMGIVQAPSIDKFWSRKSLYNGLWARAFMTKRRFKQIMSFLKLSNEDNEEASNDKLFKVHLLFEYIRRKCQSLYQSGQNLSIDERMVRNKGRYSFRQYIRDKPTKWGMKLWVLAEAKTGYTMDFELYLGKNTGNQLEGGLAYNVVMKLVKRLADKGYRIFFDNFYTTLKLMKDLFLKGIGACGTILSNRKGYPNQLKDIKKFEKASNRGDSRWIREEEILTTQWRDNKTISVMSNFHTANESVKVIRRTKINTKFEKLEVDQPGVIRDYNQYMGGVDRSDQLIGKYQVLRKTNKWWKTLFFHMIDISKVNSYILFNNWRSQFPKHIEMRRPNRYTQLEFAEELIRQLGNFALHMDPFVYKKPVAFESHPIIPAFSSFRRNCKLCFQKTSKEVKTWVKCETCGVHLCFQKDRNCLREFHDR